MLIDDGYLKNEVLGLNQQLEYCEISEQFFDFCLWEYSPMNPPHNKLRSINLLNASLDGSKAEDAIKTICNSIREAIGVNKTVWGVKKYGEQLSWELYFYDYHRLEREISATKLLSLLKDILPCSLIVDENTPYFMFSLDLDSDTLIHNNVLEEINIYIGHPSTDVSSGLNYTLSSQGLALTNLYHFYDRDSQFDDILAKIICSAHLDLTQIDINHILWPELLDCKTIVVANKKNNDGLYFCRVTIDVLILFLQRCDYSDTLITFCQQHRDGFSHLLFDVGIDYTMINGRIKILKSAFYGFF